MKESLRINFVMPPVPKISGGPVGIIQYANRLAARGHKVSITTFPDSNWHGDNPFPWAKFNGPIFYTRDRGKTKPASVILEGHVPPPYPAPFEWMAWEPQTWLGVMDAMPDCDINVATFWTTTFPVYFSQKGKPVYFMQHYEEVFYTMDPGTILQKMAVRMSYSLPIYKIANCTWLQKQIRERHGQEIPYSHPGIELGDFSPRPKPSEQDGIIRVLTYANPTPWKGFADAVAAMQKVLARYGTKVEWHVFGYQHPYFPENNGYAPYIYHPNLPFKDLAALYATSDIVLCPSWYESYPAPPQEAMASGTVVVTTEYGTEDFCHHEQNALVVGSRDIDGMAASIARLVEDKDLRVRLAAAGLKTSAGFSWDPAIDSREQILLAIHRGEVGYDVQSAAKFNLLDAAGIEFERAPKEINLPNAALFTAADIYFFYYDGVLHQVANKDLVPELLRRGAVQVTPDILTFARMTRGATIVSVADIPAANLAQAA